MSILRPDRRKDRGRQGRQYMDFVSQLPCLACSRFGLRQLSRTEVAHVGPHGLGAKSSNINTIPLCTYHHTEGPDAYHRGVARFWARMGFTWQEAVDGLKAIFVGRGGTLN